MAWRSLPLLMALALVASAQTIAEGPLKEASRTGVCAGAETLLNGGWIWCGGTEDAVYTLTAWKDESGEAVPAHLRLYLIDWSFYLAQRSSRWKEAVRIQRDLALLKHAEFKAGFIAVERYSLSDGENFIIESRYNNRGQLVSAKVLP